MLVSILDSLFKILNGKNISFAVLLTISVLSGYFVFEITQKIMSDNTTLIKSLYSINDSLKEILSTLKEHEAHEKKIH